MDRLKAVFDNREQLTKAIKQIEEEFQQGVKILGIQAKPPKNLHHKGTTLVYQWEKMGNETGGLIGKTIGLGFLGGLKAASMVSKSIFQVTKATRFTEANNGAQQEDEKKYQLVIETDEPIANKLVEIFWEHGVKEVTQDS